MQYNIFKTSIFVTTVLERLFSKMTKPLFQSLKVIPKVFSWFQG